MERSKVYEKIIKAILNGNGYMLDNYDLKVSDDIPVSKNIQFWYLNKTTIIVINYGKDGACVYVPIQNTNNIDNEVKAIEDISMDDMPFIKVDNIRKHSTMNMPEPK